MLSSAATGGEECNCHRKTLNRLSFSTSSRSLSSSASSSSPSPFSASYPHQTPTSSTKTMEEVWKDINLASLNDHNPQSLSANSNLRSVNFQDFLARPFNLEPPTSMISSAPPPVTALSLSSGPDFHFDPLRSCRNIQLLEPHHHPSLNVSSFTTPYETLACDSGFPASGSKRSAESDSNSGDRRHKRMIKNRESAARSRARKQEKIASFTLLKRNNYTNELELKVHLLSEENERLRRQQEQLDKADATQQKKKKALHRSSTAPF